MGRVEQLREQLADARGGRVVLLDRRALNEDINEDIIAANVRPGEGLFIRGLRRRLARAGASIAMAEHDLLAEPGIGSPGRGGAGRPAIG